MTFDELIGTALYQDVFKEPTEKIMAIETPKWYSNLKTWRMENGCTGELWDIYVKVTHERFKQGVHAGILTGILIGIVLSYLYVYLRS